jgi:hypothetical protein
VKPPAGSGNPGGDQHASFKHALNLQKTLSVANGQILSAKNIWLAVSSFEPGSPSKCHIFETKSKDA